MIEAAMVEEDCLRADPPVGVSRLPIAIKEEMVSAPPPPLPGSRVFVGGGPNQPRRPTPPRLLSTGLA